MCGTVVEGPEQEPTTVVVRGKTIVEYADLCEACEGRAERNATKYLGPVTRPTKKQGH